MELNRYLNILRRWIGMLILSAILTGAVAYLVLQTQPSVFISEVRLLVGPGVDSPNPDLNALRTGGQIMQTYAQLITTRPILEAVNNKLQLGMSTGKLNSKISVKADPETQILTITVSDNDAERAAAIANGVANEILQLGEASTTGQVGQDKAEIRRQAEKQKAVVIAAEARVREIEAELQNTFNPESQKAIADQEILIATLEADLRAPRDPEIQAQISASEERIKELEAGLGATTSLEARRLTLDQLNFETNRVAGLIDRERQAKTATLNQLTQARTHLINLNKAVEDRRSEISGRLSEERSRIADAERSLSSLLPLLQITPTNQVRVIESAVPSSPETKEPTLYVIMAAIAGFIVAFLIAVAYESFDDKVRTVDDLTNAVDIPLLASVASAQTSKVSSWQQLPAIAFPQSSTADSYRMLGGRFASLNGQSALRSVMLTSVTQGGDMSEAAANLAIKLAQGGKRVILVDANLHGSGVGRIFNLSGPGLADLLQITAAPVQVTKVDAVPRLFVLTSGSAVSNPSELLASPNLVERLEQLHQYADIVVISAPPLLSSTDSLLLASRVDQVILFVQQGVTRRPEIAEAVQSLRSMGAHIAGMVLDHSSYRRVKPAQVPTKGHSTIKGADVGRVGSTGVLAENLSVLNVNARSPEVPRRMAEK